MGDSEKSQASKLCLHSYCLVNLHVMKSWG